MFVLLFLVAPLPVMPAGSQTLARAFPGRGERGNPPLLRRPLKRPPRSLWQEDRGEERAFRVPPGPDDTCAAEPGAEDRAQVT